MHFEVQVRGLGAGIAGAADVADHIPALDRLFLGPGHRHSAAGARSSSTNVRWARTGRSSARRVRCRTVFPPCISHREYGSTGIGQDVDGIVYAAFAACIGEGIAQLRGQDALHRQQQAGRCIRSLRGGGAVVAGGAVARGAGSTHRRGGRRRWRCRQRGGYRLTPIATQPPPAPVPAVRPIRSAAKDAWAYSCISTGTEVSTASATRTASSWSCVRSHAIRSCPRAGSGVPCRP